MECVVQAAVVAVIVGSVLWMLPTIIERVISKPYPVPAKGAIFLTGGGHCLSVLAMVIFDVWCCDVCVGIYGIVPTRLSCYHVLV
jgi:hypothetical protein